MPLTKFLTHLRRNVVAYLALVVALGTSTAYAAGSIPDGSVTAAKLHKNAVTSNKIKDGTIKPKDIKKPTYVQSTHPGRRHAAGADARRGQRGALRLHAADTRAAPASRCSSRRSPRSCTTATPTPSVGLYIDNVPIAGTRTNVPATPATARSS